MFKNLEKIFWNLTAFSNILVKDLQVAKIPKILFISLLLIIIFMLIHVFGM